LYLSYLLEELVFGVGIAVSNGWPTDLELFAVDRKIKWYVHVCMLCVVLYILKLFATLLDGIIILRVNDDDANLQPMFLRRRR
jgi:hypothetical protein